MPGRVCQAKEAVRTNSPNGSKGLRQHYRQPSNCGDKRPKRGPVHSWLDLICSQADNGLRTGDSQVLKRSV